MNIADNVCQLIGNTPLVRLNRVTRGCFAHVIVKIEATNPGNSVKDRAAWSMIDAAEKQGLLDKETVVIEPTSGNTGIGLAMVCAVKGYPIIICMPESMSIERQKILKGLGAQLELTPGKTGMKGAIEKAKQLAAQLPKAFIPMQFENPANPGIHHRTTAPEIWRDTGGKIDIFISAAGTGGTFTGTSEALKQFNPNIKTIAVEPDVSPVLSGGEPAPHKIQGMGPGFIPKIMNTEIIDEILQVSFEESVDMAKRLMKEEGIISGPSSGGAVAAALKVAKREENKDKMIVTILPDTGERYLSTELFD